MPQIYPDINPMRSFVFVRTSSNRIVQRTDIRLQKVGGNLKRTAIDLTLTPQKIKFITQNQAINVQKGKKPQDRFIDLLI